VFELEGKDDALIDAAAQAYASEKEARGLITEWHVEQAKKKKN
jgi:hypothetical protein